MRTPGQFQQNFPRELAFSEAAALAGMDAIEFRLNQTTDARLIGVLKAVRDASGWQTRPSPAPSARATGPTPVSGQGVSVMLRSGHLLGVRLPGHRRAEHRQGHRGQVHDRRGSGDRRSTRCS